MILYLQTGHSGTSEEGDISQRQLELQYSRVVQAAFLYSRVNNITCDLIITCESLKLAHSVLCLIITWVPPALSFVIHYYVSTSRTLFWVWLLLFLLTHSVLCLINTLKPRALCFEFDYYVSTSQALFRVRFLR